MPSTEVNKSSTKFETYQPTYNKNQTKLCKISNNNRKKKRSFLKINEISTYLYQTINKLAFRCIIETMNNPNRKNISAVLNALTEDDSIKKKSAVFRVYFKDIENALKSGVPRNQIVQALNDNGLEISIAMFSEYLYRERKKRLKEKTTSLAEKKEILTAPFIEKEKAVDLDLTTKKSEPETEPVKEWKSNYSKNDPRMIDEILRNPTDIDALAKEYRELKKKSKQ